MSRLEELTSRFEATEAADAAAAVNASTQTESGAADAVAGNTENAGDAGTQNAADEVAGADGAAAGAAAAAPAAAAESDEPPGWFSKALQREQVERANIAKEISSLREKIESRGGAATPAETRQLQNAAANLEESNQRFAKIKATLGKDFDSFEQSGQVLGELTAVAEEQSNLIAAQAKQIKELNDRLNAGDARSQAVVQAEEYWQTFAQGNPGVDGQKLWNDSLQEARTRGLKGDAMAGAAEVLWQMKVDAAKEAAKQAPQTSTGSPAPKTPTAPARTPTITPGGARVVQSGAGARTPAAIKSAEKQIEDGDVDFGYAGRYQRFSG